MVLTPRRPIPSTPARPASPSASASATAAGLLPAPASADAANEAIRALVDARAGQEWSSVESAKYEVLLIEWAAATRTGGPDVIEAA
ncbi:hypothetical protein OHA98_12480 [Streptomyces sp. NBC_00654]|uniref:hypothetical protein n=1 Tax=Streptomyces sp. NBC_00654 TaxID=2975799 RepID=UPI0022540864|nr:hypothetical protein [Streptomyces sp. NBC_00654]MCX4965640.1 hypothetical protein [Streptomyces sp. NBC_00654]